MATGPAPYPVVTNRFFRQRITRIPYPRGNGINTRCFCGCYGRCSGFRYGRIHLITALRGSPIGNYEKHHGEKNEETLHLLSPLSYDFNRPHSYIANSQHSDRCHNPRLLIQHRGRIFTCQGKRRKHKTPMLAYKPMEEGKVTAEVTGFGLVGQERLIAEVSWQSKRAPWPRTWRWPYTHTPPFRRPRWRPPNSFLATPRTFCHGGSNPPFSQSNGIYSRQAFFKEFHVNSRFDPSYP